MIASAAAGGGVQLTIGTAITHHADNDFNGDGRSDILWRNDDGTLTDWLGTASGGLSSNSANFNTTADPSWHIAGPGTSTVTAGLTHLGQDDGTVTNWLGPATGGFSSNWANVTPTPILTGKSPVSAITTATAGTTLSGEQRRHCHRVGRPVEWRLRQQLGEFRPQPTSAGKSPVRATSTATVGMTLSGATAMAPSSIGSVRPTADSAGIGLISTPTRILVEISAIGISTATAGTTSFGATPTAW